MDPLRFVKYYATREHGEQLYAGNLPYTHHLAAVEAVLRRFGYGFTDWCNLHSAGHCSECQDMLTAAWLHDLIEDTRDTPQEVKRKDIAEMFGERVADLVEAVTDEPGPNRKVRKALTYPKTRACPGAVALKLADRIANLEHGGDLVKMYRKEHEDFKRALYTPGEYEAMWAHLDGLLAK
jgi:guanosine-3',5'-bis(diphosphate) 3'-pyrophosphohydrolase